MRFDPHKMSRYLRLKITVGYNSPQMSLYKENMECDFSTLFLINFFMK